MKDRYRFQFNPANSLVDVDRFKSEVEKRLLYCVTDPSSWVGYGYGFSYTPGMAEELLEKPLSVDTDLLSDLGADFFRRPHSRPRIKLGVQGESISEVDQWYMQGLEPTCVPFSVLNAFSSRGETLNSLLLARMLNKANGIYSNKIGMKDRDVKRYLHKYQESPFEVKQMYPSVTYLKDYASIIQQALKAGNPILESVSGAYVGDSIFDVPLHQIALVGYSTTFSGIMDLQVIDSNYGMLFLPAEYLFQTREGSLMVIGRKANLGLKANG